jgi:ABC-type antimicrobial peptide transport system permease subunit
MYTLPSPRYKWYEPSNYQKIQDSVTAETNKVTEKLGFYQPRTYLGLLDTVKLASAATMMIGLVLGIVVVLFIIISVLLIYSLLMISVETKTFETGVMRMLGLSKWQTISMIFIQSCFFVLPSILLAYVSSIPVIMKIYGFIFESGDVSVSPLPAP